MHHWAIGFHVISRALLILSRNHDPWYSIHLVSKRFCSFGRTIHWNCSFSFVIIIRNTKLNHIITLIAMLNFSWTQIRINDKQEKQLNDLIQDAFYDRTYDYYCCWFHFFFSWNFFSNVIRFMPIKLPVYRLHQQFHWSHKICNLYHFFRCDFWFKVCIPMILIFAE